MLPESSSQGRLERLRHLVCISHLNQSQFARRLGIDASFLSRVLSGKLPLTEGFVNRAVVNFGVSKDWLWQGEGVPYPKIEPGITQISDRHTRLAVSAEPKGTPVYDIDVTAGVAELSSMFTDDRIVGRFIIPRLSEQTPLVRVSGDSMTPKIKDGSYIAIRRINNLDTIFWGRIYVVVLDDYRMVKYLRRHPQRPDFVVLHSENPEYDDIEVPRSEIRSLFLVEGIINYDILA